MPSRGASEHPNDAARRRLARELHGRGVEFGPGCHPLPLGPFVKQVCYCDQLDRATFAGAFPEVAQESDGFPDPIDYRLDFDKEWFVEQIGKGKQDFVVANHVLEHLVNPIRFLEQCHQLLDVGGLLYVGLPDKRAMFDRDRQRTRLSDLIDRYQRNETALSAARVEAYVNQVDRPGRPFGPGVPEYESQVERHRRRSVHVNVWLIEDALELFVYLGRELGMGWELVDGLAADEEFLLLFRKTDDAGACERYPLVLARIWADSQRHHLQTHYLPRLERLDELSLAIHDRLLVIDERLREVQNFVRRVKGLLARLPGAGLWRRRHEE